MKPLICLFSGTALLLAIALFSRAEAPVGEIPEVERPNPLFLRAEARLREADAMDPPPSEGRPLNNMEPSPALAQIEGSEQNFSVTLAPGGEMTGALALEAVLGSARAAAQGPSSQTAYSDILLRGVVLGATEINPFRLMFNARGCYLQEIEGPVTVTTGFDGRTGWELATVRPPHQLRNTDLTIPAPVISVLTGRWLAATGSSSPAISLESTSPERVTLRMASCLVTLNRHNWLPERVALGEAGRTEIWQLEAYRPTLGRMVPHQLVRLRSGRRDQFRVESVTRVRKLDRNPYQPSRRMAELVLEGQKPG